MGVAIARSVRRAVLCFAELYSVDRTDLEDAAFELAHPANPVGTLPASRKFIGVLFWRTEKNDRLCQETAAVPQGG